MSGWRAARGGYGMGRKRLEEVCVWEIWVGSPGPQPLKVSLIALSFCTIEVAVLVLALALLSEGPSVAVRYHH